GGTNGNGYRNQFNLGSGAEALDVHQGCQIDFPESGFLYSVSDGNIITHVDSDGNVVDTGSGSSCATFDNECFSQAVVAYNEGGVFEY
ncbi:hypothetical protein, partial [Pseudoalteromonas marina]